MVQIKIYGQFRCSAMCNVQCKVTMQMKETMELNKCPIICRIGTDLKSNNEIFFCRNQSTQDQPEDDF